MITIGKIIGDKYMIESFVGSGGMAQVYRAHDVTNGQVVAIKILKDEFRNDAEFIRRFEREARAGLTLTNDHIVHSLDVGEDGDLHYIVFEYINGKTLKEYIKENGVLSPKAAVNFAVQILDALTLAHERGIIHRDVKPQNVMITGSGVAKLTDFGIARDLSSSTKTFTGSDVLGSVHYISPEQARGAEVTQQSDLYSVAIMLYEMLTGLVPFDSDNSVSIALKHLSEDIKPPIELNNAIPPALNDVVLKAAAKNPAMRYATAEDMTVDLKKSLSDPYGRFVTNPASNGAELQSNIDNGDSIASDDSVADTPLPLLDVGTSSKKINKGVFKILITLGAIISLLVVAFIITTVNYNFSHIHVPDLYGRTYDEAVKLVNDNFDVVVIGKKTDSEIIESGKILEQTPIAGTRANPGTTIEVIVSIDKDDVIVPDLTDMTLLEASNTITRAGLNLGGVYYDSESRETAGRIYEQEPKFNEEVPHGSEVTLYISGTAPDSAYMPNVTSETLDTAVSTLNSFGFTHIIVRYENSDDDTVMGTVFEQSVNAGVELDKDMMIIISVYGELAGPYSADRAYNVSVEENDTPVMATILTDDGYEVVVYESLMSQGTQTASFTARLDTEGVYTCILYVNNVEDRREEIRFVYND